uniref:Uncharacterized protein n=1 Tax=Arundo donax TaxID=35708 RepID=A0A0A8Z445_ARUDO
MNAFFSLDNTIQFEINDVLAANFTLPCCIQYICMCVF